MPAVLPRVIRIAVLLLLAAGAFLQAQTSPAVVALAGNSGTEEFKDALELSDGTILIVGTAENLDWIAAPKTELAPLAIPNRNTGRTAFLMRVSADLSTILGAWHLPHGRAHDFRWIKTTGAPGASTGTVYLSGACDITSGDYFIARLDADFMSATPSCFSWVRVAKVNNTHGSNLGLQAWDVGGDGRVAYVDQTGETIRVFLLDASGNPLKLPDLRGSHWNAGAPLDDANRLAGLGSEFSTAVISGISFPADLRSWTEPDRLALLPDGNGEIKQGAWPLDLFTPVRDKDGGTTGTIQYGYTGYRSLGKYRIGGIAIDRLTNDLSIGFNIQTRFWDAPANKEQGDFEPAVVCFSQSGALKWWSRLYHEVIDANDNLAVDPGETRISTPDQYLDGLVYDHSTTPASLVVAARCHGNNTINLWRGNAISFNPAASGFQNQFTGSEGNIHIGWIGKIRATDGTLLHASYVSGYFRNTTLTQSSYADPALDGWPSHNSGWPNLTTTRIETGSVRTDAAGRVHLVGIGPRMVTTTNAWQKLPKITNTLNEGISPWAQFVRVMTPDLSSLAYSSALTGEWTYPTPGAQPVGADNTDLYGVFPLTNGTLAVGRQRDSGNPVPANNPPPWASITPAGVSGLLARLPFSDGGSAPSRLPVIATPPASVPPVIPGKVAQLNTLASDPDDPEHTLTYTWSPIASPPGGSISFSPNANNDSKQSTASFTGAGTHTLRVTVTDPSGRSVSSEIAVLVEARDFDSWISQQTGTNGMNDPEDDPDHDGTANLMEYALGGLPGTVDPGILPISSLMEINGMAYPVLNVVRNPQATGISFTVETSNDLLDWKSGAGETEVLVNQPGLLVVRSMRAADASNPAQFLRLKIQEFP
jgi:hypothetical protein